MVDSSLIRKNEELSEMTTRCHSLSLDGPIVCLFINDRTNRHNQAIEKEVLLKLRDDIQCSLNSSEVATADYSKAFDTICHEILLKKLNGLGFCSSFIPLISKYLTDRYQFVQIEVEKSALADVMCVVPQGSILGPILYMLQTCLH